MAPIGLRSGGTPLADKRGGRKVPRGRLDSDSPAASWYEILVSSRTGRERRGVWIARAIAWLLAVVFITSSVTIDPDCLFDVGAERSDCGDEKAPCPCPLDCASCVTVRTIPPTGPVVELVPTPSRVAGDPPPVEADGCPRSPAPGEISHVPKS